MSALTLLILLLILGMGCWLLFVRPYAQNLIDSAMTSAVNQFTFPAEASQLPAGQQLPLTESTINALIPSSASSNPVQNLNASITPSNVRISFQVYGLDNAISLVPKVENGHLVVTNVNIEGLAWLLISPEELTSLLDRHLTNIQNKLQQQAKRSITDVKLVNHEILLILG